MSTPSVDAALAGLRRRDPNLGELAEAAVDWLGLHSDTDHLNQYWLQRFLWYELPRRWLVPADEEAQLLEDVRVALSSLLARLGMDQYAFVSRSTTTEDVHAAYLDSERAGLKAADRAMDRSGVVPPSLDDFIWGELMGPEEATAHHRVASALETSIRDGQLIVGQRGWQVRRRELTSDVLALSDPEHPGITRRDAVYAERCERWTQATRPTRLARLRLHFAPRLMRPITPPEDLDVSLEPLLWFLGAAEEGIALTATGNLNRAFVQTAVELHEWWPLPDPPRTEDEVVELVDLHEIAIALRAVRRRGRVLRITSAGRELLHQPTMLWSQLVPLLAYPVGFTGAAFEALLMLLLDEHSHGGRPISLEEPATLLEVEGFATTEGDPPTVEDLERALGDPLRLLEFFGVTSTIGFWGTRRIRLGPAGEAMCLALLRECATAPVTWQEF